MASPVDLTSWADVAPLPQLEAPDAPFAIAYSARYSLVYGYVRALQASGERSARALQLTAEAAELNPAHYSVWSLRRQCLDALLPPAAGAAGGGGAWGLPQELAWLAALMRRKGCWKNYQVWHHRRLVVERLGDGSLEMALTSEAFEDCPKNYHAWSHRQWAVRALTGDGGGGGAAGAGAPPPLGSWQAELAFAAALLAEDLRNNSAWNHRWFVLTRGGGAPRALPRARWPAPADLAQEVAFCAAALRPVRRNEAAWSHLRACVLLARVQGAAAAAPGAAPDAPPAAPASTGCMEDLRRAPAGLGWGAWPEVLALARECQAGGSSAAAGGGGDGGDGEAAAAAAASYNAAACEVLGEHAEASGDGAGARAHYSRAGQGDAIRAQYWKWREGQVEG